jgi:hypothetical protein
MSSLATYVEGKEIRLKEGELEKVKEYREELADNLHPRDCCIRPVPPSALFKNSEDFRHSLTSEDLAQYRPQAV